MFFFSSSARRRKFNYTKSRHFYTPFNRHEQSLDIYQPTTTTRRKILNKDDDDNDENDDALVLVLVMGSGWMGHAKWVYMMTNWWNSQCPDSICSQLGITCITIRHSGGFFNPIILTIFTIVMLCLIRPTWYVLWLLCYIILFVQSFGAATMDEMLQDVSTAINFLHNNTQKLGLDNNNNNNKDCKFVVGGYSSGAHLAATYLNRIQHLNHNNNNNNNERIVGVCYLSGVLSLKNDIIMKLICMIVFGTTTDRLPSPLDDMITSSRTTSSSSSTTTLPIICTLPHLLIGCQYEIFGIPYILDNVFCSNKYYQHISDGNKFSRCILLPSSSLTSTNNHWTMLSSIDLTTALEENFFTTFTSNNNDNNNNNNNNNKNNNNTLVNDDSGDDDSGYGDDGRNKNDKLLRKRTSAISSTKKLVS